MMATILSLIPSAGWLPAIGMGLAALFGLLFKVRSDGRKAAEYDHAMKAIEEQKEIDGAKTRMVEEIVRNPDPVRTDKRLRNGEF